jgi:hemoglobin/transferrin/lactoferrin receptor protein
MLPRYDRLSEFSGGKLKFAEWYYKQNRMLASYSLLLSGKTAVYDNARFILAYQNIDQERVNRRFNNNKRSAQMEDVTIFSFNADLAKSLSLKNEMKYGVEITSNDVQSAATKTDIVTGVSEKDVTRYPDGGSTFNTAAIYLSDNHKLNDNWIFSGGLRFN